MTGALTPRSARRRFTAVNFLFWLPVGLCLPSQVLLLGERGMGLAAIAGLFAVHSLTVAALELPTGGLSDVIGRRTVLAAAGVFNLTALTLLALGTTIWALTLAMVLMGSGRALSSGPAEAWYVDTVQAHSGPGAELRTGLARGNTACATALALGTLIGGGLPWLLQGPASGLGGGLDAATGGALLPLSVPALLGAAVGLVFVTYVLTALREPPRLPATPRGVLRGVPATVVGGLRLGARDGLVRRVLLTAAAAGTALAAIELLAPGRAAALTGAAESGALLFAALACAGFLCTALGSHCAPSAARLAGSGERAVLVSLALSATGLTLLGATLLWTGTTALVLAAAGYALVYFGLGSAGPNENDLLHHRVDSAGRATALSVKSLALQLAAALAGLVAGVLPTGPLPWLLVAGVLLMGAGSWIRPAPLPPAPLPTGAVAPEGVAREGAAPAEPLVSSAPAGRPVAAAAVATGGSPVGAGSPPVRPGTEELTGPADPTARTGAADPAGSPPPVTASGRLPPGLAEAPSTGLSGELRRALPRELPRGPATGLPETPGSVRHPSG
ncbi:MFS transporter [Streptomyces xinghaiensis]|uniref:MFS transporter n=1 Tax=Streptomyces xinghaiensis TaxID=1038928 RepID=UPI00341D2353